LSRIDSTLKELRIQTLNKTNFIKKIAQIYDSNTYSVKIPVLCNKVILSRIKSKLKELLGDSHGWYLVYTSETIFMQKALDLKHGQNTDLLFQEVTYHLKNQFDQSLMY